MVCDVLFFWQQFDVSDDSEIFSSLKAGIVPKTCLADKLCVSQSSNSWMLAMTSATDCSFGLTLPSSSALSQRLVE
jgi:hypothetical protein